MGVIYKTTNLINNKIYIGKRVFSSEKFIRNKYYGSGRLLKDAIKKYGIENFTREILEEVDNVLLDIREIYWIKYYNSNDLKIGYNLTIGGNSKYGRKAKIFTQETKKKISDSLIKYFKENEAPFSGKKHTDETKEKIRNKLLGVKQSPDRIKKNADAHKGMKYSKLPKPIKIKIDQSIKIKQLSINGELIRVWNSMMDAARELNIDRSGISRACSGIHKQCGGYKWAYLN